MTDNAIQWKAEVFITLKPSVLDPQGATVQRELLAMGYKDLTNVRLGKYLQLYFNGQRTRPEVEKQVKQMCERLLANPVIEHYRYQLSTVSFSPASSTPQVSK